MHIEAIKEVLVRAMNKHFQFSNNIMLLPLLHQAGASKKLAHVWFLDTAFVHNISVCICVCSPLRL